MTTGVDSEAVKVVSLRLGGGNAINRAFFATLSAELGAAEHSDVPAVVLTGHERFFSAGLDLITLYDHSRAEMQEEMQVFTEGLLGLAAFPKPIVAAINGHAIGGGCILGMACDYRIAAEGTYQIGLNEVKLGVPFPMAALELARAAIPVEHHAETMLFGKLFPPGEALRRNLIQEVVPAEDLIKTARSRAAELGASPPPGFARIKRDWRGPMVERVRALAATQLKAFLDIWFDPATRTRLGEMRAALLAKKKS